MAALLEAMGLRPRRNRSSSPRNGVESGSALKMVLNSDNPAYGGSGRLEREVPTSTFQISDEGMHGKPASLKVPYVPPYGVMIFER